MTALLDITSPSVAEWDEVLRADPRSVVTQTPTWASCVYADGVHRDASRLYRFADDRRIVVPLARRRGLPAGLAPHGSWPFDWGIGGPLADGPVSTAHARAVFTDLASAGVRVTVRTGPDADPVWAEAPAPYTRTTHHSSVVDLRPGFDDVWAHSFRSSVRRAVRKAERSPLRVEVDTTGALIADFDQLYRLSVDRWAGAQHEPRVLARWRSHRSNPVQKFRTVAQRFGDRCSVSIAYLGSRPVAGLIVLRHGRHAKYWRGAMDVDLASPVRANDQLHRLAIEAACAAGCHSYHMGESRPGSTLARFKAGFGAVERPGHSFMMERLPLTAAQDRARTLVKRALRFQDL